MPVYGAIAYSNSSEKSFFRQFQVPMRQETADIQPPFAAVLLNLRVMKVRFFCFSTQVQQTAADTTDKHKLGEQFSPRFCTASHPVTLLAIY
jgi:hypothetical protein